jgi:ABC-type antimicrobial peptide transport system permease subunit
MAVPFKYNWRNLRVRWTATGMTAFGIFLVVMIVMVVSALLGGTEKSLSASGSPDNVIVLSKSAANEAFSGQSRDVLGIVKAMDGIKLDETGAKMVSEEFAMSLRPLKPGGPNPFWQLRGVTPMAMKVHDGVRLEPGGAWPQGPGELAFGIATATTYHYKLGDTVELSGKSYRITGLFSARGSSLENEIWMDLNILNAEFKKNYLTSVLVKLEQPAQVRPFAAALAAETRISAKGWPEREYYATQNFMGDTLKKMGRIMALLLGFGALFGGMNTMFTAVAARRREIGTLRALGFSRGAILAAFVLESLGIALIGFFPAALLGLALYLIRVANAGGFRGGAIQLSLTPGGWLLSLATALALGLLGGLLPSLMAARMKLVDSLRSS